MTVDVKPRTWTLERLLAATGGHRVCGSGERVFEGLGIDSRTIGKHEVFLAITGQNHDGHHFVSHVLEQGVRGFVVNRENKRALGLIQACPDTVCVAVDDTTRALGALGALQRRESGARLVAITGSNGKTSTRAMTAAVLEQGFSTLSTRGNFNNEIGLPLTLLRLSSDHQWAVVEMGMNAQGEIARLADMARPDLGIITNVAPAHLEGLGSIENVARAKAELLDALPPEGHALLNADDPLVATLADHCRCRVLTFGSSHRADIQSRNIRVDQGTVRFDLCALGKRVPVTLNTPGRFMVSNALAAAGVGLLAGLDPEAVKTGLESFEPVNGRMRVLKSPKGFFVIDDTYNANPASMMAAIGTLRDLKGTGRGFLVVGDMRELGAQSDELHRSVGAFAVRNGVDRLFAFGDKAGLIAEEALAQGLDQRSVFAGSKHDIIASLRETLDRGDGVLVKGSRTMAMEDIVLKLMDLNGD